MIIIISHELKKENPSGKSVVKCIEHFYNAKS